MTKKPMTPTKLRTILACILLLLSIAGVGAFILGYQRVASFSNETQQLANQARASNSDLSNLIATKKMLSDNADVVDRASMMVAESKQYNYQDQMLEDLYRYASQSGISITNYSFADVTKSSTSTAAATPSASTNAASSVALPPGIKTVQASVTVAGPLKYTSVLQFVHLLEQGLFKMRLVQIGVTSSTDAATGQAMVSVDTLTVEAFVRT